MRALGHGNHKRIYRVYCALGLNQTRRAMRRLPTRESERLLVPDRQKQVWSAVFMSDVLYHSTRFRTYNVIDDHNRESLAIQIDTSLRAPWVIRVLERLNEQRDVPDVLRLDNGPEFNSQALADWCEENAVLIRHIQRASRPRMPSWKASMAISETMPEPALVPVNR